LGTTAAALMMGGCSSSGSPASPTVSGIAATGAPIAGQVRLKDSSATPKEYTASTNSDGSYVFNVAGLTPPFIVKADWTNGAGPQTLVSFANGPSTANITPLSHLIVATAAGGNDPATLYTSWEPATRSQIANGLATATSQVKTRLQPLLAAYNVDYDPISGPFAANKTGMDAMLDAVKISIAEGTVTVTNRETGGTIFAAPMMNMASGTINTTNMPVATPAQIPQQIDGAALYAGKCASCHGSLAGSTKKGASVARIQSAINANIGNMGSISSITTQEVQAITTALAIPGQPPTSVPTPVPGTTTPAAVDGATLYAGNCAGCHGDIATSSKKGITLTRLQGAINNNIGHMGPLSSLTPAELQGIVDALTGTTPAPTPAPTPTPAPAPGSPVDGNALYTGNCAGCHGAL